MLHLGPLVPPISWGSVAHFGLQANTFAFAKEYAGAARSSPGRRMERKVRQRFVQRLLLVFMRGVGTYAHYVLEQELVVA